MNKVHLTEAEKEVVENLRDTMGMTKIEAFEHVVNYKRNLAFHYEQKGNFELAEHILKELGEWTEERRKYQQANHPEIILPGDE